MRQQNQSSTRAKQQNAYAWQVNLFAEKMCSLWVSTPAFHWFRMSTKLHLQSQVTYNYSEGALVLV